MAKRLQAFASSECENNIFPKFKIGGRCCELNFCHSVKKNKLTKTELKLRQHYSNIKIFTTNKHNLQFWLSYLETQQVRLHLMLQEMGGVARNKLNSIVEPFNTFCLVSNKSGSS